MTTNKRKLSDDDFYESESYTRQKIDEDQQLLLQNDVYDSCGWANKPIDIKAQMDAWKEFSHLLDHDHVWFSELGLPNDPNREVPLLLPKLHPTTTGKSTSVLPPSSIASGQKFPEIANVYVGKPFYIMMPMKLSTAYMYPLGNFGRQVSPNAKENPFPQDVDDIKKIKYNYCYNTSAAHSNFSIKDPISQEAMKWLALYEEEFSRICKPLGIEVGSKFSVPNNHYFDVSWSPFRPIDSKKELSEYDFKPIHETFKKFQENKKFGFFPPMMFRLNPERANDSNVSPLLLVPPEEQHAYELENDIHLIVFKVDRVAGLKKQICVDLKYVISLEDGYEGLPSEDWFQQAKKREPTLTPEQLYVRTQIPYKQYGKNV